MISVARRYSFVATHELDVPGIDDPAWTERHGHRYTVEVVAEVGAAPGEGVAVVVDTDLLDDAADYVLEGLDGSNLNESVGGPTSVEDLAQRFLLRLRERPGTERLVEVSVWEDDDRRGRARL